MIQKPIEVKCFCFIETWSAQIEKNDSNAEKGIEIEFLELTCLKVHTSRRPYT